jgi:putative flavoprotein involved in K+ transport
MYRGRDIMAWLERAGVLDDTTSQVRDIARARAKGSWQLIGHPNRRTLDLALLQQAGVRLLGRAVGVSNGVLHLEDDLTETTVAAQTALERLLTRVDAVADVDRAPHESWPARFDPGTSPDRLDLHAEGIRTVIWCTGFKRDYRWLQVPALDAAGEIRHDGGITPLSGLYVLGLRFMRRRRSNFLDGVGIDAEELAAHITSLLANAHRTAA